MYLYKSYTDLELFQSLRPTESELYAQLEAQTASTIRAFVDEFLPGWVQRACTRYVDECVILQINWTRLCTEWKTAPKEILIVEFLPTTDWTQYEFLGKVCNVLTKYGYVVRNCSELTTCAQCDAAMLTEVVLAHVRERNPKMFSFQWDTRCLKCRD